jgi:hypothetical protein
MDLVPAAVGDAAQLLEVEVDQLAGVLALIADHHPADSVGAGKPVHAMAAQHPIGWAMRVPSRLGVSTAQADRGDPQLSTTLTGTTLACWSLGRWWVLLACRTAHWRMRTQAGGNETWRAAGTRSTPQLRQRLRTIDGVSVGLSRHR